MRRTAIALLVLSLTAFAPAPFSKGGGGAGGISLRSFQGKWRRTMIQTAGADGKLTHSPVGKVTHVRIVENRWTFLPDDYAGANLLFAIDTTTKPARFTFYSPSAPAKVHGVGLIRWHGKAVQLLYTWGGEDRRPPRFDPTPPGYWLCTLDRE